MAACKPYGALALAPERPTLPTPPRHLHTVPPTPSKSHPGTEMVPVRQSALIQPNNAPSTLQLPIDQQGNNSSMINTHTYMHTCKTDAQVLHLAIPFSLAPTPPPTPPSLTCPSTQLNEPWRQPSKGGPSAYLLMVPTPPRGPQDPGWRTPGTVRCYDPTSHEGLPSSQPESQHAVANARAAKRYFAAGGYSHCHPRTCKHANRQPPISTCAGTCAYRTPALCPQC